MKTVLDLHKFHFLHGETFEQELETILDNFLSPFLINKKSYKLIIIVGRGLNSNRFIDRKNPLRFYTERYLDKLNLKYSQSTFSDNKEGEITVWV